MKLTDQERAITIHALKRLLKEYEESHDFIKTEKLIKNIIKKLKRQ